jgi:hypothetical protein
MPGTAANVQLPVASPPPGSPLIPLAEQFRNHDEFRPPATPALAGSHARLSFADGSQAEVALGHDRIRWSAQPTLLWGPEGEASYEAVEVRENVYAVTVARLDRGASALVVADLANEHVFVNLTAFAGRGAATRERTLFFSAGIDRPARKLVARTTELVGRRVAHRYSTTHLFEHIYLNPNTYVFQGLRGPEAGVSDIDRADYWKLGDQLYLFSWHERAQPFNGAVVIDLLSRRATGRLVGWDTASGQTLQVRTGSLLTVLSHTEYDGL